MFNDLFKPMDILHKGLAASWTRNAVIRNNIANIETPGFKASGVEFESLFKRALHGQGITTKTTHVNHRVFSNSGIENVTPRIYRRNDLSMRADGNNVDIEAENVRLAQNSLFYNTIMEKMNSEIRRLRMAITEAR